MTGGSSHGRVLGMGAGLKAKDVYGSSSSSSCTKRCAEECMRENEEWCSRMKEMEDEHDRLKAQISTIVQQILQSYDITQNVGHTSAGETSHLV